MPRNMKKPAGHRKRVLHGWAARDRDSGPRHNSDDNGVDLFFHPSAVAARAPKAVVSKRNFLDDSTVAYEPNERPVTFYPRRRAAEVPLCAAAFKRLLGFLPKPGTRQRVRVTVEFIGATERVTTSDR